ncbi:MAG: hypothetical protein ACREDT_02275 [Methylocella sp.]
MEGSTADELPGAFLAGLINTGSIEEQATGEHKFGQRVRLPRASAWSTAGRDFFGRHR